MLRLSTILVAAFLPSVTFAQEKNAENAPAEENVHYDKLKVLEPIIGTWARDYSSVKGEVETTFSWSPTKKMIVSTSRNRIAEPDEDIKRKEWTDGGARIFYVWNAESECIEQHAFYTSVGRAAAHKVLPKGKGVFDFVPIHPPTSSGDMTMTITEDEIHVEIVNREGENGESLDDRHFVSKRIR
jgi:hypothetical protein